MLRPIVPYRAEPTPPPAVEPYRPPDGELVTLDEWRGHMRDARLATIGTPGLYLDRSPTGAGKSYADRPAMSAAGRSLILLPAHANCAELAESLRADGFDAAAYPALTEQTCRAYAEASAVMVAGLSVSDTICWRCPHRDECTYREAMDEASTAPHAIATHRRGALGMLSLAEGRPLVLVHEDPTAILRPVYTASLDDLDRLAAALAAGRARALHPTCQDPDMYGWLADLSAVTDWLAARLDRATATEPLACDRRREPCPRWQATLWGALRHTGTPPPPGDALRAVVALVAGDVVSAAVQVDHYLAAGGQPEPVATVVVVTRTALPSRATIWLADATADPQTLETLAGRPVAERTPGGRLEARTPAVHVPHDVTRGMSAATVADLLRGVLTAWPDARRVGLIGHRPHIRSLTGRRSPLSTSDRERITRTAYYGEGPDRASNGWLECDLLIVCGTPRVPPAAIRRELIRRGHLVAAADPDAGRWGARHWGGRTVAGEPITVQGLGYADPDWQSVQRDLVTAALVQAAGRGRGVLTDGVPVVVLSNEPLGLPLVENSAAWNAPPRVRQAAEVVTRHCSGSLKEYSLAEPEQWRGVSTAAVAAELGISKATASEHLTAAARLGLVCRSAKRKGGWYPPYPPCCGPPG